MGVKDTVTGAFRAAESPCSISGRVPVPAAHAVGAHRAHHLGADQIDFGRLTGPGGSGGGNDYNVVGLQQVVAETRGKGQQDRRRVAAGHGDPGGAPECLTLAGKFREPVGPGAGVRGAVELFPGGRILEPVVGAGVDHDGACGQLRGDLRGGSVRQGQEHNVVSGQVVHCGVFEDTAGQTVEMGLQFP